MSYVSSCYYGFNGGMRVRTYPMCRYSYSAYPADQLPVTRRWTLGIFRTIISRAFSDSDSTSVNSTGLYDQLDWDDMWTGAQFTTEQMSEVTGIELPFYRNLRFASA